MAEYLLDFDPTTFQPDSFSELIANFLLEHHFEELSVQARLS